MTLNLYTWLLRAALPLALLRLYWRSLRAPAYRNRIAERLALESSPPDPVDVWIHAVSVGEVQAAQPLVAHLLAQEPPQRVLVTTTTPTGAARVVELFGKRVTHRYMPYDLPGVMQRFLGHTRPHLVVVMETEIWPNMLAACTKRAIPVILANARLSERSARGYRRIGKLARETLQRLDLIAAQAPADAERFLALGVDPEHIQVTGSIKFDLTMPPSLHEQAEVMRRLWGTSRPVWVAASTHEGEDEQMLEAHRLIRDHLPNALLVLVPRHPERFERVAALATRTGMTLVRRTEDRACTTDTAVFLGDTMGELPAFLEAADSAFIGGSLVATGGHNLLEAAAVGTPVAVGPHTFNFAAITDLLISEGAAARVENARALAELMTRWLGDAVLRHEIGARGREVVTRNRGALERLIEAIDARL